MRCRSGSALTLGKVRAEAVNIQCIKVGLTDFTGLRPAPFILPPHYVPEDAALIAARLPLPYPILALRDGQSWFVDSDDQYLVDPE